ncbi:MAG TPA: tRNA pseudouridine(54/55) synthase Pus10 [Candidatus Thermoplasmatota archaeon]|nr:tRNA pseudouridine(54/55) synthase Pus10 [Candidatus Thermoplasmatota archaeon]
MTERPLLAHLDTARRAQAEFGLCDACLGRRFGRVETGLTNPQRARVFDLPPVDVKACWLCEGLFGELDALAEVAVAALAPYEHRHFLVGTRLDPAMELREAELTATLGTAETSERIQSELNREVGKRVSARTDKPVEFKQPDITVILDARFFDAELQFGALYVFGRYRKLDRTIPQTKWPCNRCGGRGCAQCGLTGQQYPTSVEALVAAPFLEATGATQESFHGAGREDIDARCLGEGRPFVLELNDPRVRAIDLAPMAERVRQHSGGRVEVSELRFTTKAEVAHVKEHGGSKTYLARVAFAAPVSAEALRAAVDALRGASVKQRTPQRVEHRRADLVRERKVLAIDVEEHDRASAAIRVRGDAGLYIKELVSSDEGRTEPSLAGLLGVAARVTELDIVAVEYEPPAAVAAPSRPPPQPF